MLQVKSVAILKTIPGILRELFRIWKQSQNKEDRKKCEAKKKKYAKKIVYIAMN